MTNTTLRFMNCDYAGCTAQQPHPLSERYMADRPDGWTDAIYTHGCPEHGEAITAHRATITSQTRGRGSREKTTWFLTCACGWRPSPNYQTHSSSWLQKRHIQHVQHATAELGIAAWVAARLTDQVRTDGGFDPCIGGGSSRECERGECNARAMCAAAHQAQLAAEKEIS